MNGLKTVHYLMLSGGEYCIINFSYIVKMKTENTEISIVSLNSQNYFETFEKMSFPRVLGGIQFLKIVLNFVPTIRDAFPIRDGLRRAGMIKKRLNQRSNFVILQLFQQN